MKELLVYLFLGWVMTSVTFLADIGLRSLLGGTERKYRHDPVSSMRRHLITRRFLFWALGANYSVLALMMWGGQDTAGPMQFTSAALSWSILATLLIRIFSEHPQGTTSR